MRRSLAIVALTVGLVFLAFPGEGAQLPSPGATCTTAAPLPNGAGIAAIAGLLEDGAAHWWTRSVPGSFDVVGEGFNLGYYADCSTPAWGCEGGTRVVAQTGCSTAAIVVVSNFGFAKMGAYTIIVR